MGHGNIIIAASIRIESMDTCLQYGHLTTGSEILELSTHAPVVFAKADCVETGELVEHLQTFRFHAGVRGSTISTTLFTAKTLICFIPI